MFAYAMSMSASSEPDPDFPYCKVCKVILNGHLQHLDHRKGRMHRRKLTESWHSDVSTAAPSESSAADHPTFDSEAHWRMLQESSQPQLAAKGQAARLIQRAWRKHRGRLVHE